MTPSPDPDGPRLIEFTGERCVPWAPDAAMVYEHFHRYLWAARLLAGRSVLDLGSGEGFGAALLAEAATEVTGLDVDAEAVAHAQRRYGSERVRFLQGSALDLAGFAPGGFDAVVAFEMIEHVADHERLLAEVDRVLAPDGILVVSTPDRDLYSAAAGQVNEFHEHELTQAEFRSLLHTRFAHVALWGQRTIAGSELRPLDGGPAARGEGPSFLLLPDGEEWRVAEEPPALFCVAVASRVELPAAGGHSTLADTTLQLRAEVQRAGDREVAERDRLLAHANAELADKRREVLDVGARLSAVEADLRAEGDRLWQTRVELDEALQFQRRVQESVSWQLFQRARGLLYEAIGEDSRLGRGLGALLRAIGRSLPGGRSR